MLGVIFHQFLAAKTGCASYVLGCGRVGVCAVVDPLQEIEPYLEVAGRDAMRITHIFETHVHSDHLSGARRLAAATRASILFHESAPVEFNHVGLEDGEEHELGNVRLTILHTPGHTPDGISILVTDRTRALEPWFVLTGDTLLVGGVGGPDLPGQNAATVLAEQLYESTCGRLLKLPDHVEVYPAHVGDAAGGNGSSDKPGSTIGFERRFNPALRFTSRSEFVRFVLAGLRPPPEAFAENRRRNLDGE